MGYLKKGASNVLYTDPFLIDIYLSKVNDRNNRAWCKISTKLTIKSSERRHWCCFGVFTVNFEYISHLALAFLFLNLHM